MKLDEREIIEIAYCRAEGCRHNLGEGECKITKVDTKISIDTAGRCEDFSVKLS